MTHKLRFSPDLPSSEVSAFYSLENRVFKKQLLFSNGLGDSPVQDLIAVFPCLSKRFLYKTLFNVTGIISKLFCLFILFCCFAGLGRFLEEKNCWQCSHACTRGQEKLTVSAAKAAADKGSNQQKWLSPRWSLSFALLPSPRPEDSPCCKAIL